MRIAIVKSTNQNMVYLLLRFNLDLTHPIWEVKLNLVSMFGVAYGDARIPNWPHLHRTPLPGISTTGLRRDKGRKLNLV